MKLRTYSELCELKTFEERFSYLKLDGSVGQDTFGFDRVFNQMFYGSKEWKRTRDTVILRDNGCDLGLLGFEIYDGIFVHHMNPISLSDIKNRTEYLFNPEYLICTSFVTHNGIHYGNDFTVKHFMIKERTPFDTCPWKKQKEL